MRHATALLILSVVVAWSVAPAVAQEGTPSSVSIPPRPRSGTALNQRSPGSLIRAEQGRHTTNNGILLRSYEHGAWMPQSGPAPTLQEQLAPGFVGPPGTNSVLVDGPTPQDNFIEAVFKTLFRSFFSILSDVNTLLNFIDFEQFFVDAFTPPQAQPAADTGMTTQVPGSFQSTVP